MGIDQNGAIEQSNDRCYARICRLCADKMAASWPFSSPMEETLATLMKIWWSFILSSSG